MTKPRITVLILVCTAVGYFFGSPNSFHLAPFVHVLLGTALMASGTAALNQWYEADSDARMRRTSMRPIPAGRIRSSDGLVFGTLLAAAGFTDLWWGTNAFAAGLGLFTLVTYIFLYTPLKRRSAVCTTVGALPGAMPPLIGYAAASGILDSGALALFLILFVWQFPHFYAIAWLYREDYARGEPERERERAANAKRDAERAAAQAAGHERWLAQQEREAANKQAFANYQAGH